MIETRLLKYFLMVAQEHSFSRAAEKLHISQPTLSKQMADLEQKLNTSLFFRNKGIFLTEAGLYLAKQAEDILRTLENTESYFANPDIISGTIVMGTGEYRSFLPVLECLKRFQDQYPEVKYRIVSGEADLLVEQLASGKLDLAFLLDPAINERYEYDRLRLYESWGLLVRSDHPLAQKEFLEIGDMKDLDLIVPSQASNRTQALSFLGHENYRIKASYNLIYNAALMVEAGIGCAVCLSNLVEVSHHTRLHFIPFLPQVLSQVVITRKKNQPESPAVQKLIQDILLEFRM